MKASLIGIAVTMCLCASAVIAQTPANPYFDPQVALQGDCGIEGAFATNSASNRDAGATREQEVARFKSYGQPTNAFEASRAQADIAAINFVFDNPNLHGEDIRSAVFQRCMVRGKNPHDYAGKDESTFH